MALSEKEERAAIIKVLCLCILWYSISSGNNVIGKMLLNEFPYPMSVTLVQLIAITFLSGPVLRCIGVRRQVDISWQYYKSIVIPLAIGKFVASVFSHVSLWKVPVSYSHTVKATMPFFTVVLGRLCFGEKQSTRVYLSLVPIILGVSVATVTELSFDVIGLAAALFATCGFSLQNIFSKKVLNDTGIHPLRLLHLLGRLALLMFLPVWLLYDGYRMLHDTHLSVRRSSSETLVLLAADGCLNWLQNLVAFSILHKVAPLTYAVANATKRVAIVLVSLAILGNPVTPSNVLGMMMAILGVLAYNKAKYDANKSAKRVSSLLPVLASQSPFSNGGVGSDALHQLHPAYYYDYNRNSSSHKTAAVMSSHNGSASHHPLLTTDLGNGYGPSLGNGGAGSSAAAANGFVTVDASSGGAAAAPSHQGGVHGNASGAGGKYSYPASGNAGGFDYPHITSIDSNRNSNTVNKTARSQYTT